MVKEFIPSIAFWLRFLATTAINVLGFTNAVIYIRPRFLKFRKDFPAVSISSSVWHTLARTGPPRCPSSTTGRGGGRGSAGGSATTRQNHERNEQNGSHWSHSFLVFHRGLMSRMRAFFGASVKKDEVEASLRVQNEGENHAAPDDQMDINNDNKESFLLDSTVHHHGKDNHTGLKRDGIRADSDSDKNIVNDDIEHNIDELEVNNSRRTSMETTLSAIEKVNHWNTRGLIRGVSDSIVGNGNGNIDDQFLDEEEDLADGLLEFNNNRRSIERTLSRSFAVAETVNHCNAGGLIREGSDKSIGSNDDIVDEQFH